MQVTLGVIVRNYVETGCWLAQTRLFLVLGCNILGLCLQALASGAKQSLEVGVDDAVFIHLGSDFALLQERVDLSFVKYRFHVVHFGEQFFALLQLPQKTGSF